MGKPIMDTSRMDGAQRARRKREAAGIMTPQQEIARLREALSEAAEHVRHAPDCGTRGSDDECDCGAAAYMDRVALLLACATPLGAAPQEDGS